MGADAEIVRRSVGDDEEVMVSVSVVVETIRAQSPS